MNPVSDFGTRARPIRASSLPMLLKCSLRQVLLHLGTIDDDSGTAAHTGNLTHCAIEHWHKHDHDQKAALDHMLSNAEKFPRGDPDEAARYFYPYCADPRNQKAEVRYCEYPCEFTIQEAEGDPHGPIYIRGTLDQIRWNVGEQRLELWDVKTGQRYSGWELIHVYAAQQAAYVLGACQVLDTPVYPGGIIRPYGYRTRDAVLPEPGGVFWHSPWNIADCHVLLADVRNRVKVVREGNAVPVAGDQCMYCPAGGLNKCLSLFKKM